MVTIIRRDGSSYTPKPKNWDSMSSVAKSNYQSATGGIGEKSSSGGSGGGSSSSSRQVQPGETLAITRPNEQGGTTTVTRGGKVIVRNSSGQVERYFVEPTEARQEINRVINSEKKFISNQATKIALAAGYTPGSRAAEEYVKSVIEKRKADPELLKLNPQSLLTPGRLTLRFPAQKKPFKETPGQIGTIPKGLMARAEKLSQREKNLENFQNWVRDKLRIQPNRKHKELWAQGNIFKAGANYVKELGKDAASWILTELPAMPMVIGGRAALTIDAATSKYGRQKILESIKEVPGAVVRAYDVRDPRGALNVILTVAAVRMLAKSRAAQLKFKKDLKAAKITKAKVYVTKDAKGNVVVNKYGQIKIGDKYYPFQERSVVSKARIGANKYNAKSVAKFKIGDNSFKTVKTSQTFRQQTYTKQFGLDTAKQVLERAGVVKVKGTKINFATTGVGDRFTTILNQKQGSQFLRGVIKDVSSPSSKITKFDLEAASVWVSKPSFTASLKIALNKISTKLGTKGLSKTAKSTLSSNYNTISSYLKLGKKAQVAIPRIPGESTFIDHFTGVTKGSTTPLVQSFQFPASGLASIFGAAAVGLLPRLVTIPPYSLAPPKSLLDGKVVPADYSWLLNDVFTQIELKALTEAQPAVETQALSETQPLTQVINQYESTTVNEGSTTITDIFPVEVPPVVIPRIIPFVPGFGGAPGAGARGFTIPFTQFTQGDSFMYVADIAARIKGQRARARQREELLDPRRVFTGYESRLLT